MGAVMEEDNETKIWRQVFKKQIKLKMERYMERTQVEASRPKEDSAWDSARDHAPNPNRSGDVASKTEYINRLTSLRDSLMDQEEVNLAQALERLRLHSITNKSHSNRLRMNANDYFISAQPLITQRRNMISTVERFRQIRPKRHQPVIFPLQGRQMLDVPRPASEEPISNFGNATNRSTDRSFTFGANTARPSPAKIDETVQSNLQRLIQRTSSIPNIGRKALKQQEDLEPKAKPLLNIRAKLQKQPGSQLVSPFLLSTHEPPADPENPLQQRSLDRDRDTQNLSPHAHKLGPVLQDDTLNMDVLHQYYQTYIDSGGSPSEHPPRSHSHSDKLKDSRQHSHSHSTQGHHHHQLQKHRHYPVRFNGMTKHQQQQQYHPQLGSPAGTQYNSIVSSSGRVISLSDLPDIMPRTTYTYYSTTHNSSSANGDHLGEYDKMARFPELQTSYRYHMGVSDAASSAGTSGVSKSWLRTVQRRRHNNSPVDEEEITPNATGEVGSDGKMKIVVDMPNIIFNAASPDVEVGPEFGSHQGVQPENVLKKAMKQQEIRKKELNNLLDDVKELNMRTEVMTSASAAHGT